MFGRQRIDHGSDLAWAFRERAVDLEPRPRRPARPADAVALRRCLTRASRHGLRDRLAEGAIAAR